jgi:hypothetical protein
MSTPYNYAYRIIHILYYWLLLNGIKTESIN